jgi:hypothetical protein
VANVKTLSNRIRREQPVFAEALDLLQRQQDDSVRSIATVRTAVENIPSASAAETPGNITSFGTLTYRHLPQSKVTEFRCIPVPPVPLGVFDGINVGCEAPDRSGEPQLVADGATPWDGTKKAVGDVQPKPVLVFHYSAARPNAPAVFTVPLIDSDMTVRVIAQSFSASGATGDYDTSPSATIAVTGYSAVKPASGTAWTENAQFGGAPAMYTDTVSGKKKRYLDFSGIVLPADKKFAGWEIWSGGWPNDTNKYAESERHTDTRCIVEVDEPASVITVTFYLRSMGFDASGAVQRNPIVEGVTPSMSATIGTTAGTLDLQKAFNFYSSEFEIDLIQGFRVKNVDFTKAKAGTFDSSTFDSAGLFAIKTGGVGNTHLAAGSVTTLKLTTNALDVGGGGGKPIQFRVFDNLGAAIGWIGDDTANTGYVGAWLKRLLIGGTSPATAKFFADASGNVVAAGIYVNSAGAPLGWIGANGAETGAWFKTLGIGGSSKSTAPLQADASGNVSLTNAAISVTAGNDLINIDTTNGVKLSNVVVGTNTQLTNGTVRVEARSNSATYALVNTAQLFIQDTQSAGGGNYAYRRLTANSVTGIELDYYNEGTGASGNMKLTTSTLSIGGNQVVGPRQPAVTAPSGGTTVDTQARTAINDIIARLQGMGTIF